MLDVQYHCDFRSTKGGWVGVPPPPHHLGIVYVDGPQLEEYLCALWAHDSIYVALELLERERTPEEEAWVLKNLRGWVLQTYCWRPDPENQILICDGHRPYDVPPEPARKEELYEWRKEIYRDLMVRCVRIAASTPISLPSLPTSKRR